MSRSLRSSTNPRAPDHRDPLGKLACAEVKAPAWGRDRPPGVQEDRSPPGNRDVPLARHRLGRRAEVAGVAQDVGDGGRLRVGRGRAGEGVTRLRVAPELVDDPAGLVALGIVVAGGYLSRDALVIDDLTVAADDTRLRLKCEHTVAVTDGSVPY